jgi:hypothetical protein
LSFWNGRIVVKMFSQDKAFGVVLVSFTAIGARYTPTHRVCGVRGAGVSVSDPCTTKRGQWNPKLWRL